MAYRQHQDLGTRWVNMGQKPIEGQIAASPPGDDQLALPKVDFAANLWVLHQNLQRVKNQSGCACGLTGVPPFTRAMTYALTSAPAYTALLPKVAW